jgi:hypothetical protein
MRLICRAMAPFLQPARPRGHNFVRKAARRQRLQVSRQNLVDRIVSNQSDGRDLNHRAPGFGPLGARQANGQHYDLHFVQLVVAGAQRQIRQRVFAPSRLSAMILDMPTAVASSFRFPLQLGTTAQYGITGQPRGPCRSERGRQSRPKPSMCLGLVPRVPLCASSTSR